MKKLFRSIGSLAMTTVAVIIAAFVLVHLWHYYRDEPWTRDAYVQADVVEVAPDVGGLVTDVRVQDNDAVHRGDILFVVDQSRYRLAERQAEANVARAESSLAQWQREARRNENLSQLVSKEVAEEGRAKVDTAQADLAAEQVALDRAKLNLERTVVRSPRDGYVNDRTVRVGDYVTTGHAVLSVVDAGSVHVDGYFEETKLSHIHLGDRVRIHLMGEDSALSGHVQSLAAGIADRNRSPGNNLLPNVNPTFNWVRLAQRVPVRIAIDSVPKGVRLIVGRTATVAVQQDKVDDDNAIHGNPTAVAPARSTP